MYSREQIDQVRAAVDIVDVVREYVPTLVVQGRSAKGLCPFHSERTPSFHVQPEKGFYKCFGCGESGDVISFISKLEQVSFTESLEKLAGQAGIVLKKERSANVPVEPEGIREKMFRVLEAAKNYYKDRLWEPVGENARTYLADRGITDDTTEKFELGFAPSGESVFEALVKKGFPMEVCQQAGLVTRSAQGRFYDPLFGRLIFPIFDGFGHVVGFGGRVMPAKKNAIPGLTDESRDSDGPKYINSPETPVFSKGKLLYGLMQAKPHILAKRRAVVMEGYMDVIGTHQGGVEIAVATLGTALTRDHAKLLRRYADEVVAFFDPDEAGRRAAMKGLDPLLQELIYPKVVVQEGEQDPDELILELGKEKFEALLAEAPDFVDFILRGAAAAPSASLQDKAQLANQLITVIASSPNEILKAEWTAKVSKVLQLDLESLNKELAKKNRPAPNGSGASAPTRKPPESQKFLPSAEEEFLQLLFSHPVFIEEGGVEAAWFDSERNRRVYDLLKKHQAASGKLSLPGLNDDMPEADREWFMRLLLEEKEYADAGERRQQLIRDLRLAHDRRRLAFIEGELRRGAADEKLKEEYLQLLPRVRGSKRLTASGS